MRIKLKRQNFAQLIHINVLMCERMNSGAMYSEKLMPFRVILNYCGSLYFIFFFDNWWISVFYTSYFCLKFMFKKKLKARWWPNIPCLYEAWQVVRPDIHRLSYALSLNTHGFDELPNSTSIGSITYWTHIHVGPASN